MGDIIVIIIFSVVVGIVFLVRVRVVRVICFSRCRLVDFSLLESQGQKQVSGFTAIRAPLLFELFFQACSFNFPQFGRLEYDWSRVSAVCLDWPAVAESEETVCVDLGGCMGRGCGSIVTSSGALMLRRPSLSVGIDTGWSTVDSISASWVFNAGSAVAAASTAWAGVGMGGCKGRGCGSIVTSSGALMLRRPSLSVGIDTGWSKTVDSISVSWVFNAGSAVAAVSDVTTA